MSIIKSEGVVWACDHPKCDRKHFAAIGESPTGYAGQVEHPIRGKTIVTDWYACEHVHITGAILAKIRERRGRA